VLPSEEIAIVIVHLVPRLHGSLLHVPPAPGIRCAANDVLKYDPAVSGPLTLVKSHRMYLMPFLVYFGTLAEMVRIRLP
jgi:hypothetical protein